MEKLSKKAEKGIYGKIRGLLMNFSKSNAVQLMQSVHFICGNKIENVQNITKNEIDWFSWLTRNK
ncbi:hypothetical protein T12_9698 [Trichinella patagoniensis]|uniref:Uncharacterized protein n=1 Tax=Trichinella patagoniensis TaxID=990121 RepID=A0A0V1AG61_9BILA|nr:hypothetical protein T12_9698 [Trichinella patagoniensis]